jgi:hypothetical protein
VKVNRAYSRGSESGEYCLGSCRWKELTSFRVTQEPHKHPHFVSLLVHLFRQPATTPAAEGADQEEPATGEKRKAEGEQEPECGREIVEDLSRAFRSWVEGRQWLNMRLCVSANRLFDQTCIDGWDSCNSSRCSSRRV